MNWKSPRTIGALIAAAALAVAISQGMFWSWESVDYIEWGIIAVLALVGAAAVKYLLGIGKRKS